MKLDLNHDAELVKDVFVVPQDRSEELKQLICDIKGNRSKKSIEIEEIAARCNNATELTLCMVYFGAIDMVYGMEKEL